MAEFPHIGEHCSMESCRQLDFLPLQCDGCGSVFCLHHQSKASHGCSECLLTSSSGHHARSHAYDCSIPGCKNRELIPVFCDHCQLSFCMSHRHQQDHKCRQLKKESVRNAATAQHISKILGLKRQDKDQKKVLRTAKSRETAAKVAVMKLKTQADGDSGIPETERIFFLIFMPLAHSRPPKPLFFSKRWTVGRVVDWTADKAGITNPNNTSSKMIQSEIQKAKLQRKTYAVQNSITKFFDQNDKKLRLFLQDSGKVLPSDQVLVDLLDEDQGVFNGCSLVMETVPADLLILPDIHLYTQ